MTEAGETTTRPAGAREAIAASNVRAQAGVLRKGSTVIAGLIRYGKLKLAGGVYDLTSGKVTMMEV